MKISNSLNVSQPKINKLAKMKSNFKDVFEEKCAKEQNVVECEELKIGSAGNLLGYSNNAWNDIDRCVVVPKCQPNEIVISPGFTQIGADLFKNLGRVLGQDRSESYAVKSNAGIENKFNSLVLIPGTKIKLSDGTILEWESGRVSFKTRGSSIDEHSRAIGISTTMDDFTRIANRQLIGLGQPTGINKVFTEDVLRVLSAAGIDTSKEFYINGKSFKYDHLDGTIDYELESHINGKYRVRHINVDTFIKLVEKQ